MATVENYLDPLTYQVIGFIYIGNNIICSSFFHCNQHKIKSDNGYENISIDQYTHTCFDYA